MGISNPQKSFWAKKIKDYQKLGKNQSFQEWRFQTWETGMEQNTKTPTNISLYKNPVKVPVKQVQSKYDDENIFLRWTVI